MIYGNLFANHLYYELALMQGQGINTKDKNDQKDVILRLDYRPTENWRIVASGQLGTGHAIAESKYNPGIAVGEIDLDYLDKIRASLPSLKNRRGDVYDTIRK